jgi:DNA repair protein RadC
VVHALESRLARDRSALGLACNATEGSVLRVTEVVVGDLVDIRILDHLIVAGGDVISFAERGLI